MKKEIRYGGYSANRSDYDSEDGELAVSMGVVNEEGQLRHMAMPKELAEMPSGYDIVYIHKTAVYEHYILRKEQPQSQEVRTPILYWMPASVVTQAVTTPVSSTEITNVIWNKEIGLFANKIYEVSAVGNTLVVLTESGLHYALWVDNGYKYLGQKPPMVELQFGLSENKDGWYESVGVTESSLIGELPVCAGALTMDFSTKTTVSSDRHTVIFNSSVQEDVTDTLWAMINKSNAVVTKDGHFYAPFYVRYCYRMYDGTMWMQSAPVFMPVSSPDGFHTTFFFDFDHHSMVPYYVDSEGRIGEGAAYWGMTSVFILYWPNNVALKFKVMNGDALNELRNSWGDIVKSVDIFVTQPLVREDVSEKITTMTVRDDVYTLRDGEVVRWTPTMSYNGESATAPKILFDIPKLTEKAYLDKIQSEGTFYKVASYDLASDTLPTDEYSEVNISKDTLPALATQEAMKDDYNSHNILLPLLNDGDNKTNITIYNSRMNVSAVRERLFEGFNINTLVPMCNNTPTTVRAVYVFLRTEQGEKVVRWQAEEGCEVSAQMLYNCPLFYPDRRAVRMEIAITEEIGRQVETRIVLPMQEHTMLNGAITKGNIMTSLGVSFTTDDSDDDSIVLSDEMTYPNKLYTSEVDNPFYFPVEGINTIGTGLILGVGTAAKALSQGQFGQYPLYAFTDDGVWALTVTTTGTYRAVQPVTRDVVLDGESITQLDDAVLYATSRGIMVIRGSDSRCISDVLLANEEFSIADLSHLAGLLPEDMPTEIKPFKKFVQGCRMIYDYVNQHIVVFNPQSGATYPYAYVFSLKSKMWGMMQSDLRKPLNSYPDALAMTKGNMLVTLSESDEGVGAHSVGKSLIVTRPLKLGDGNVFKSVHTVVQRGMFRKGTVQTLLYASRDLWNWHLIGSSTDHWIRGLRGSGYKWFRIAVLATLGKGESVSGATVEFEPREVNKIH